MIHLTDAAVQLLYKTKEVENIRDEVGIRLTALSEDDLGPSYDIRFDYRSKRDHVFGPEGAEVFVTPETLIIMDGGTFDAAAVDDGGVAFKITNPNYVREISSSGGCSSGGCSSGGCSSGGCSSGGCSSGGCSSGGCSSGGCCSR